MASHSNTWRRLLVGALTLASIVVPATRAGAASERYVALGDSYTAAPLVPRQLVGAGGCFRSDHDYPHDVQRALNVAAFADVSCTGATTDNMWRHQGVLGGSNPAQFLALPASTTLVTLGIGGNDIGFTTILLHCLSLAPTGSPCHDRYVRNGNDQIAGAITALAPKIAHVISDIHVRAPHARVFVVGYPAILPDTGPGCWPSMPITSSDVVYLRSKERQLNNMLAAQAGAHNATFVNTYIPSIGHNACTSPTTRWVEPVVPAHAAAPVHPNANGEQAMADLVRAAMGR
jgi:lysophospholipase L1-like esterase